MQRNSLKLPQKVLSRYEILETLSERPMRAIMKARDRESGELRVIKLVRAHHVDDDNLQLRFRREARVAMRMEHPHIARFYEFVIEGSLACLVKEHVDGETLEKILERDGPPELAVTVEVALQTLAALSYVHGKGYVHRDVAPDNLMMARMEGDEPFVKLIDLGITKRLGGREDLTAVGRFVGKARYSSPEYFREESPDLRSDLYSFGVVLYELLTGHHPVRGHTFADLFRGHVIRPPRDFSETDPYDRIPGELREVVLRALEKDPDQRVGTARELAELLKPFRGIEDPLQGWALPASGFQPRGSPR